MPVDPSISLDVTGATPPPSPLDTIGKFAETQERLNQIRLFNQTFAARQAAGQIFATSPDLATANDRLSRDPMVSAYAPELVNLGRENQLVMTQLQGLQQGQAATGFEGFMKTLPAIYNHPGSWGDVVGAQLNLLPPAIRAQVAPSIEMIRKGLTDGLPEDPQGAMDQFHSRLNGMMIAAGITPELIRQVAGTPGTLNTGGATVGTMQAPAGEPNAGALTQAPGGVGMTLAPQLADVPNPQGGTQKQIVGGAAAPTTLGATPNITQTGELGAGADQAKLLTNEANNLTSVLPVRLKALDTVIDTMRQTKLGGGTPTREVVAQAAQGLRNIGLNISDETINKIAGGSLPALQLFNTQLKPMLVSMLTHDAAGQGRVMLPEVEAYIHLLDTAKDPRAIIGALNNIRYGYQVGFDRAQKWNTYKNSGGDPSNFSADYAAHFDPAKLPQKAGSLSFAPTDPKSVLGGNEGGVTHRWNPKTGKIEAVQ